MKFGKGDEMRIRGGINPISIPEKVSVSMTGDILVFSGPKGEIKRALPKEVKAKIENNEIHIAVDDGFIHGKSYYNLCVKLISNAIKGVAEGFEKVLEMEGVGFRAEKKGEDLVLNLGYSHPVVIKKVVGVDLAVEGKQIRVTGADIELVGDVAAKIRSKRPPEPYKGKGIHYLGEYIRRKAGKAGKAGGA